MGWEPVLEGELAAPAWAAVRDIADELPTTPVALPCPPHVMLFWGYLAGALDDERFAHAYDVAIAEVVERIERGYPRPPLFGGLAGAGWVVAHLASGDDAREVLALIDEALVESLRDADRWEGNFDLIEGVTGLGVYFLERLGSDDAPTARVGLERVLELLAKSAIAIGDGVAWHTPASGVGPYNIARAPHGYYNCGLAHGVPAVIALLGKMAALPEPIAQAKALALRGMAWLRRQRLPAGTNSLFPSWVTASNAIEPARTAWCYGDPGIAAALWATAARTNAPTHEWETVAMECATRPPELCGVHDASICHGAAGMAHMCNRFFQASGNPMFREASRAWFARTFAMRRVREGIGGFVTIRMTDPPTTRTEHDLLLGAAGIGLALLAGLGAEEPGWDRLLLCDVPPRRS